MKDSKFKAKLRKLPVIGWLLTVQERFGEISGTALANGIALQAFLSIFPLLLVAIAVVGFVAEGNTDFAGDVIADLGLTGDAAKQMNEAIASAQESKEAASAVGLAGLLWSGLGVVNAVQRAVDRSWQFFGTGLKSKLRAFMWLGGAVVIFIATFALAVVMNFLPAIFAPLSILVGLGVNVALFLWTFFALSRERVGYKAFLPGAIFCAVGFEAMKYIGGIYVPRLVASSSATYGALGIVFAILAWLAFFGRLIVYGCVVNVVQYEGANGTVSVEVRAPRIDAAIPLEANRSGAVTARADD